MSEENNMSEEQKMLKKFYENRVESVKEEALLEMKKPKIKKEMEKELVWLEYLIKKSKNKLEEIEEKKMETLEDYKQEVWEEVYYDLMKSMLKMDQILE